MYFIWNNRYWGGGELLLGLRIICRPAFVLFCTILCCSTGIAVAQEDDHGDRNDDTATEIVLNTSISGTINHSGDIDTFRIQINTATNVIIFTTGNLDTSGRLVSPTGNPQIIFNPAGNLNDIALDDNSGDGNNFLFNALLSQGPEPYYISVAAATTGPYTFHVNADDHANSTETATALTSFGQTFGQINTGDDVDYFRIQSGVRDNFEYIYHRQFEYDRHTIR